MELIENKEKIRGKKIAADFSHYQYIDRILKECDGFLLIGKPGLNNFDNGNRHPRLSLSGSVAPPINHLHSQISKTVFASFLLLLATLSSLVCSSPVREESPSKPRISGVSLVVDQEEEGAYRRYWEYLRDLELQMSGNAGPVVLGETVQPVPQFAASNVRVKRSSDDEEAEEEDGDKKKEGEEEEEGAENEKEEKKDDENARFRAYLARAIMLSGGKRTPVSRGASYGGRR